MEEEEISIKKLKASLLILYIIVYLLSFTAFADEYSMPPPGDDIIGQSYTITVKNGDNLTKIREKNGVSYDELLESNPNINFYKLYVGQQIFIPKQFILPKIRKGIVINIAELRLYYFSKDGRRVYTFPVGLGRTEWRTPLASAFIVKKAEDPIWHVPDDIRQYVFDKTGELLPEEVPPGPKNPLGKYALYLSKSGYMIHGTNSPNSVGTFISSGCMRLLREPIELLYQEAQVGTPVHIVHYPSKAGWRGKMLYLESHVPINDYKNIDSDLNEIDAKSAIYDAIHMRPAYINWNSVSRIVQTHRGIPYLIGSAFE